MYGKAIFIQFLEVLKMYELYIVSSSWVCAVGHQVTKATGFTGREMKNSKQTEDICAIVFL